MTGVIIFFLAINAGGYFSRREYFEGIICSAAAGILMVLAEGHFIR